MKYKFKTVPYQHQLDSFNQFRYASIVAFNADMGVGKSKMAIDIIAYRNRIKDVDRVVVIAPNGVHAQWLDEQFPDHCPVPYKSLIYSSSRSNKVLRKQDSFFFTCRATEALCVLAINIESFARAKGMELVNRLFSTSKQVCAVIVDEAHSISSYPKSSPRHHGS